MGELDPGFLSHGASIQLKNSVETARHFSVSDGALISSDRAVVRSPLTVDARMRHQRDTGYKNMLAPVRDPTHHDVVKAHRGRQVRHPRSPSHPEKKRSKWGTPNTPQSNDAHSSRPAPSPNSPQVQARSSPSPPRSPSPPPAPSTRPTSPVDRDEDNDRTLAHSDSDDREYDDDTKPSIVDDLAWGRCVGAGTFGRVSFATHLPTGTPCAVKTLRKSEILRTGQLDHVRSEKAVLEAINHPLIVRLLGAAQDTHSIHLVMEFAGGGEMFGHLRREGRFSEDRARFYASEIACAISHLHRRGVAYRDLKPENGKSSSYFSYGQLVY